jgi:hypothetical protein
MSKLSAYARLQCLQEWRRSNKFFTKDELRARQQTKRQTRPQSRGWKTSEKN